MLVKDVLEGKLIIGNNVNNANDLAYLIAEELAIIPFRLLKFVFDNGFKIYVPRPNDKLFFVRNGLTLDYFAAETEWNDGKKYSEIPHILFKDKAIILIGDENDFIKNGYPDSVIIHEFAHAIDYIFGSENHFRRRGWKFLNENLPKGQPLDSRFTEDILEKFAVAFGAFFQPEGFYNKIYITHNKLKLFVKSPKIFKFFEQFFSEWAA